MQLRLGQKYVLNALAASPMSDKISFWGGGGSVVSLMSGAVQLGRSLRVQRYWGCWAASAHIRTFVWPAEAAIRWEAKYGESRSHRKSGIIPISSEIDEQPLSI